MSVKGSMTRTCVGERSSSILVNFTQTAPGIEYMQHHMIEARKGLLCPGIVPVQNWRSPKGCSHRNVAKACASCVGNFEYL